MQLYIAVVETAYTIYAVADSEAKAKRIAYKAAREWLAMSGIYYNSYAEMEENIGYNVWPCQLNGAAQ